MGAPGSWLLAPGPWLLAPGFQDNDEAYGKKEPLDTGEWVLIDERLNIDSRASTHFFSRLDFGRRSVLVSPAAWGYSAAPTCSLPVPLLPGNPFAYPP
jgi:hypothetical protein